MSKVYIWCSRRTFFRLLAIMLGFILPNSWDFSLRNFCNSYVKIFHSSHIIMHRDALLVFDKQVFNGGIETFVVDSMILVAAEKKLL